MAVAYLLPHWGTSAVGSPPPHSRQREDQVWWMVLGSEVCTK